MKIHTLISLLTALAAFTLVSGCAQSPSDVSTATQPVTTSEATIPATQPEPEANHVSVEGNIFKITGQTDFDLGTLVSLQHKNDVGNGALMLADGASEGSFVSAVYDVAEFEYLVATWNADVPEDTTVEILARAFITGTRNGETQNDWTGWLSWGEWSLYSRRASTDETDNAAGHGSDGWAFMQTDEFAVRGDSGATMVQLKAVLRRADPAAPPPVLRQITATFRNSNDGKAIKPTYIEEPVGLLPEINIGSPAYSQMVRDPAIGDSICSPTTASVLLNDRDPGLDLLPEELALSTQDFNYGFGNWAYTMAAAAAYGYETYAQYGDFDIMLQELSKGNSVGMSVRYSNTKGGKYPYLENGAATGTPGHLIAITGFKYIDNELYFLSSDSAASSDELCAGNVRVYKASQLKEATGSCLMYIIPSQLPEENAGTSAVSRIVCGMTKLDTENEYELSAFGKRIELPEDFTSQKTAQLGRGTLAYRIEGIKTDMPSDVPRMTANDKFFYGNISVSAAGDLVFDADAALAAAGVPAGEERLVTFYVIYNNGLMYIAEYKMQRGE